MSHINKEAENIFVKDYEVMLKQSGILKPSLNKNPVNPPWSFVEYEAMEKDTAKYFLYYAAIHVGLQKLDKQFGHCYVQKCLIVGAGRGRLVDYCLDCLNELKMCGLIYVIECNVEANSFLQEKYKNTNSVKVLSPFVVRTEEELLIGVEFNLCDREVKNLVKSKPITLFISELLGSFADNECIGEILSTCVNVFGSQRCISIPYNYTTYISAIYSPSLELYFKQNQDNGMHILGLPQDTIFLTKIEKLYDSLCIKTDKEINVSCNFDLLQEKSTINVTGFAGFFQANLIDDIVIDTTPTSSRNTFFWETAFFPLLSCPVDTNCKTIGLNFVRISKICSVDLQNVFCIDNTLITVLYVWKLFTGNNFDTLLSIGRHEISL